MAENPKGFTKKVSNNKGTKIAQLWSALKSMKDKDLETFSTGNGLDYAQIDLHLHLIALTLTFFKG